MTTFDLLLEEHQKLVAKLLKNENDLDTLKELREFYKRLALSVEIYCEMADHAGQDQKMWNRKASRLVELRDLIEKQSKEKP